MTASISAQRIHQADGITVTDLTREGQVKFEDTLVLGNRVKCLTWKGIHAVYSDPKINLIEFMTNPHIQRAWVTDGKKPGRIWVHIKKLTEKGVAISKLEINGNLIAIHRVPRLRVDVDITEFQGKKFYSEPKMKAASERQEPFFIARDTAEPVKADPELIELLSKTPMGQVKRFEDGTPLIDRTGIAAVSYRSNPYYHEEVTLNGYSVRDGFQKDEPFYYIPFTGGFPSNTRYVVVQKWVNNAALIQRYTTQGEEVCLVELDKQNLAARHPENCPCPQPPDPELVYEPKFTGSRREFEKFLRPSFTPTPRTLPEVPSWFNSIMDTTEELMSDDRKEELASLPFEKRLMGTAAGTFMAKKILNEIPPEVMDFQMIYTPGSASSSNQAAPEEAKDSAESKDQIEIDISESDSSDEELPNLEPAPVVSAPPKPTESTPLLGGRRTPLQQSAPNLWNAALRFFSAGYFGSQSE